MSNSVTPEMAVHQSPPSLGFSRQEHWSGLPFPSPMHESEVAQSCPTPSDAMDCSLPGSSTHGIFQARVLEWVAIAFSENYHMTQQTPFLGIYPDEIKTEKDTCTPMVTAALLTIARTWKQPRCPSTDEWIKKLWYIHTMEYYSAIKRNAFESVIMRWMKLEPIIQSEVSQKEKYKYSYTDT